MAMALLRSPAVLNMRMLMAFHTFQIVHKKAVLRKNMSLLVCSSLFHIRNDEEPSLFSQIFDSEVYHVYCSSSRTSNGPIACYHCD